jgi:hypothetical protein
MAELQTWVNGGDPASTRLEYNLKTLALVESVNEHFQNVRLEQ